jgi:hypothetical protein
VRRVSGALRRSKSLPPPDKRIAKRALDRRLGEIAEGRLRIYRLYVEEKLWVRKRNRRRRVSVPPPTGENQTWSLAFVPALTDGANPADI